MVDETAEPDREKTRAALLASLGKPRTQATEEVNWLLITDSRQMRDEFSNAKLEAETWADSVERRLAELDDQPSTAYEIESARDGLNASLKAARAIGNRIHTAFDERRALFAEMLTEVRASRKVLLNADAVAEIRVLNADGYLAQKLDVNQERFENYYGGQQVPVPAVSLPPTLQPMPQHSVTEGIDYSRAGQGVPVPAAAPKVERERAREPQRLSTVLKESVSLPPEPDRDFEPGLDF